eukprot:g83005.t1
MQCSKLHEAVKAGDQREIERLVGYKHDDSEKSGADKELTHRANRVVQLLLDRKAYASTVNLSGDTPLMKMSRHEDKEALEMARELSKIGLIFL